MQRADDHLSCRCTDLPFRMSAKQIAWKPLLVIEGPHEPNDLKPLLKNTVDFFIAHDPGRDNPEPFYVEVTKPEGVERIRFTPVLAGVIADTPFLKLFSEAIGHSAKAACQRCALAGSTAKEGSTAVRCESTQDKRSADSFLLGRKASLIRARIHHAS